MLALNSGHTERHVATPDLVRLCYSKLANQMIRDIYMLFCRSVIAMLWLLTTDDIHIFH